MDQVVAKAKKSVVLALIEEFFCEGNKDEKLLSCDSSWWVYEVGAYHVSKWPWFSSDNGLCWLSRFWWQHLESLPSFTLSVRLCNEGHENGDTWAGWTGSTHDYDVNLVIVSLTRKPKGILALRGHIKEEVLSCGVSLYDDPTFKIDYPIHGRRRAYIDIARGSYLKVLDLGRRSGYFD